jgi:predicted RNA-binding Zn ribbon-like protein
MSVSSESLPHSFELVVDFVNTRDLEEGTDELGTPEALVGWLSDRGLIDGGASAGPGDLADAIELREALRGVLLEHNGGAGHGEGSALLERAAERGRLSVRFDSDGSARIAPRDDGIPGALAGLLVPIAEGAADGTWQRVKACVGEDCEWAFYDRSRNRSGRWCDMAVCGNREKVRSYRTRQRD